MAASKDSPQRNITATQQMVASCSGAVITSLFVTPLDVVKIRLQAQQKPFSKGQCFLYRNGLMDHLCTCRNGNNTTRQWFRAPECHLTGTLGGRCNLRHLYSRPAPHFFSGTLDAFVKIARYEGVTSLWSGLPPTMFMAVPATMVYFTAYDQLKYRLGYDEFNPSTRHIPIFAGTISRIVAATIISPLELLRTKMQSQQLSYLQLGHAVRDTVRYNGLLSLMRGLGPTLLRDVPFSAFYWFGYEYIKALELQHSATTSPTFMQSFTAGAISGTVAAVLTLPFDVIKTHRQIELGEAEFMRGDKQLSSTWKLILKLYKQQGVGALFAGLVPRVVKVAPACAIMISSYEFGKTFFREYNESQEL